MRRRKYEKHGMKKSKEYNIWKHMRARCNNVQNHAYKWYGARGIKVCGRWDNSFIAFYEDMGPCPEGRSIDRIDNNKDYAPENCRWATQKEQMRNMRRNNEIYIKGEQHCLSEAAEILGVDRQLLKDRKRRGWDFDRIVNTPKITDRNKYVLYNGERTKLRDLTDKFGIPFKVVINRIQKGWELGKALIHPVGQKPNAVFLTFNGETKSLLEWSGVVGLPVVTIRGRQKKGWEIERILTEPRNENYIRY